jgi:hypothetical protein
MLSISAEGSMAEPIKASALYPLRRVFEESVRMRRLIIKQRSASTYEEELIKDQNCRVMQKQIQLQNENRKT